MRAFALWLVFVPCAAFAGWTAGPSLSGTPVDVQAYDGGYFTATTGGGGGVACGYSWNGTTATQIDCANGQPYVGAALNTTGCVVGLSGSDGRIYYGNVCGGGSFKPSVIAGTPLGAYRLRAARIGVQFLTERDGTGTYYLYGAADAGTFIGPLSAFGAIPTLQTLSAISWNGDDWALFSEGSFSVLNHYIGGTNATYHQVTLPSGAPRDLALYDNGATLGAFGIDNGGTQLWRSLDVQTVGLSQLDAGAVSLDGGTMTSVDYVQTQGSVNGRGFGLIGAGSSVLGPVPNPSAPGSSWVSRTGPTLGTATVVKVSCADPSFCVLLDSNGQVWVYTNVNAPVIVDPTGGAVVLAAGATGQQLNYAVSDNDGDPLWTSIALDAGTLANFAPVAGADSVTYDVPTCPGTAVVTMTASDGLGVHDRIAATSISWDLPAPTITGPTMVDVRAGTGPITFTAATPACGQQNAWSLSGSSPPAIDGGGTTVVITPPATACMASNSVLTLSLPAVDGGTRIATAQIIIEPYGPPFDPSFDVQQAVTLDAGLTFYPAGPIHACAAADSHITVSGLTVSNPFQALGLSVDAGIDGVSVFVPDSCLNGGTTPLTVAYARTVANPGPVAPTTQTSDAGQLSLAFQLPAPTDSSVTFSFTAAYDAGSSVVAGDVSAISATCAALRHYRADITIGANGIVIADGGFDAGGPWELAVPSQCSGDYLASATLTDQVLGGTTSTMSVPITIDTGAPAVVGNLDGTPTITCSGGGGLVTIELDGGCPSQTYEWAVDAGQGYSIDAGSSRTVALQFEANQLDQLAGSEAFLDVTVHNGSQSSSGTRGVLITPAPFITAQLNPDPVLPNEEEPAGVEVILTNTTSCDVTGIGVREGLAGLMLVPDSVRVDGRKVPSQVQGGILFVDGLALPGKATLHLTYQARVPLLGHANPKTEVVMVRPNPGVSCPLTSGGACAFDVTLPVSPGAAPRQCGCDAAPDALVLLLTLIGLLSRRRNR